MSKRSKKSRRAGLIGHSLATFALATPLVPLPWGAAWADEPQQASSDALEAIVVTASKRTENLQDAPISLTAITGDQLAQRQAVTFDDYVKLLPSVSFQSFGPGQSQINFRGISTGGDGSAAGPLPTVGYYVDETPVTTIANSLDIHMYDMARIEALSGPQGTLYGASSLAGTLRLITNKPVIGKWEGGFDVNADKFVPGGPGGSLEGFINIPIDQHMALRVMAFAQRDGGYINNTPGTRTYQRGYVDASGTFQTAPLTVNNYAFAKSNFNSVDSTGGRAALKVDLDENWTLTPTIMMQSRDARGSFLSDPHVGPRDVHDFANDVNRDAWLLASMTLQGKVSDWDLTYNAGTLTRHNDNIADYSYYTVAYDQQSVSNPASYAGYTYLKDSLGHNIDPTQIVHTFDRYTKQSHELRVSSPGDKPLRGTVGAYFQRQTNTHVADYRVTGLSSAAPPPSAADAPPSPIAGAPPDDVYYTNLYRTDRDYAIFAEGSYDITPRLTVIAGAREFLADNDVTGFSGTSGSLANAALALNCAVATVTACPNTNKVYRETGETHKLELKWQIDPNKMAYALYSTGFRPGGINRPVAISTPNNGEKIQDIPDFRSDTLANYELGWKTSWLDQKLTVNGALFWEQWKRVQYSLPGILGIFYTVNAGNARSQGIEASANWRATHNLSLAFNGTYLYARLTSDFCAQTGCDPNVNSGQLFAPAGTQLPITPRVKGTASARYGFDVGDVDAYVLGAVSYQNSTPSQLRSDWEAIVGPTGGFTTVDLSGGAAIDKISYAAYANNLFNRLGVLSKNEACASSSCLSYARTYLAKPMEIGVKLSYRF